ncbi:hypothetical protein ACQEVF_37495 [Nonomuraea polychroma]|uniref:hypothetical protein n=1 Tax=Nonomuraea polychroma TaxID=46176 RepID=UPI003D8D0E2F
MDLGTGLFIDGTWAEGTDRLEVADKYTGDVIAELPGSGRVEAAIAAAARPGTPSRRGSGRRSCGAPAGSWTKGATRSSRSTWPRPASPRQTPPPSSTAPC